MSGSDVAGEPDSYLGSDGRRHARFRLGSTDHTPTWDGSYLRECGGCWSGNAHSSAYHEEAARKVLRECAWCRGPRPVSATLTLCASCLARCGPERRAHLEGGR